MSKSKKIDTQRAFKIVFAPESFIEKFFPNQKFESSGEGKKIFAYNEAFKMGLISEEEKILLIKSQQYIDNFTKLTDDEIGDFDEFANSTASICELFYEKIKHLLEDKEIRVKFNATGHHSEN